MKPIIGLVCLTVGVYLIATSNRSMDTTAEKVRKECTGDYSKHTRNNMLGGIVLVVVGGALLLYFRGQK